MTFSTETETRLRDDVAACRFVTTAVHYYGSDKDQLANDIEAALDEIGRLRTQLKNTLDASDRLREWKESALAVEREWDAQAVAKMLGLPLGESIRKGIMRELPRLCARLAEVEKQLQEQSDFSGSMLSQAAEQKQRADKAERARDEAVQDRSKMTWANVELLERAITAERERDEAREQLAQAGVGPYLGDYYLGKLTVTGQLRAENARLREALEDLVENNTIERVARARAALAQTEAKP